MSFATFRGIGDVPVAIHYSAVVYCVEVQVGRTTLVVRVGNDSDSIELKEPLSSVLTKLKEARDADINSFDPD